MRILYCALDQVVPGTKGGSIHVQAVAEGLAALGHAVRVLTQPGRPGFPAGAVEWVAAGPPLGRPELRWLRRRGVARHASEFHADVIIERYYNFGGEGMAAAATTRAAGVLEVNAPVIDYEGSPKRTLDRVLLVEPMRRWREWQLRHAALVVTPTAAILPSWLDRERILELEWGADTDRFRPRPLLDVPAPFQRTPDEVVVVFAGAFRAWHGALRLVDAMRRLRERGRLEFRALLLGEGPELPRVRAAAAGLDRVICLGAVPHTDMPAYLAHADIGAAPFDVDAHAPLSLAFYWSPLKIFEYMASGLPVVAPALPRLEALVGHEVAGLLYDRREPAALAETIARLDDRVLRRSLGQRARMRAEREYSWQAHCQRLDRALKALA